MAHAVALSRSSKQTGFIRTSIARVTVSGSYATPGELVTASECGYTAFSFVSAATMQAGFMVEVLPVSPDSGTGEFSSFRLKFREGPASATQGALAEIADGAYPAGITAVAPVYLKVEGR